jgi:hypothetical protein
LGGYELDLDDQNVSPKIAAAKYLQTLSPSSHWQISYLGS